MPGVASFELLRRVVGVLADHDLDVWVFGGWVEELNGKISPRIHRDVDLLLRAENFTAVDQFLHNHPSFSEVFAKHFWHKRAAMFEGVLVELILVQDDDRGWFTNFWGRIRYDWPSSTFEPARLVGLQVVQAEAIIDYRSHYDRLSYKRNFLPDIDGYGGSGGC